MLNGDALCIYQVLHQPNRCRIKLTLKNRKKKKVSLHCCIFISPLRQTTRHVSSDTPWMIWWFSFGTLNLCNPHNTSCPSGCVWLIPLILFRCSSWCYCGLKNLWRRLWACEHGVQPAHEAGEQTATIWDYPRTDWQQEEADRRKCSWMHHRRKKTKQTNRKNEINTI